jgi:transposase
VKRFTAPPAERKAVDDQQAEIRHLKAELKRVTEEGDILKKAAMYFAKQSG